MLSPRCRKVGWDCAFPFLRLWSVALPSLPARSPAGASPLGLHWGTRCCGRLAWPELLGILVQLQSNRRGPGLPGTGAALGRLPRQPHEKRGLHRAKHGRGGGPSVSRVPGAFLTACSGAEEEGGAEALEGDSEAKPAAACESLGQPAGGGRVPGAMSGVTLVGYSSSSGSGSPASEEESVSSTHEAGARREGASFPSSR